MTRAVLGYEPIAALRLVAFVIEHAPGPLPSTVALWAELYAELAPIAGIRPTIAFAQAIHETGWFKFTGDAREEWNNPCGLGVGSNPILDLAPVGTVRVPRPNSSNCRFATREDGVRAHLGHLGVYFAPHDLSGFCDRDPRHVAHRRLENSTRMLGGPGRWAPSTTYGDRVYALAAAIA